MLLEYNEYYYLLWYKWKILILLDIMVSFMNNNNNGKWYFLFNIMDFILLWEIGITLFRKFGLLIGYLDIIFNKI